MSITGTWHSRRPQVRNYQAIVSYLKTNHLHYRLFSGAIGEGVTPGPHLRWLWPWHSLKYSLARVSRKRNKKTHNHRGRSVKVLRGFRNSWRIHHLKPSPIHDLCYLHVLSSCSPAWIRSSVCLVNQTWFTIKYGIQVSLFSYTSLLLNHLKQSPTNTGFLKQSIQITVHRGPGSREPNSACVRIFNHPIWGRIICSNFLRPCSLAFIIFLYFKDQLDDYFSLQQGLWYYSKSIWFHGLQGCFHVLWISELAVFIRWKLTTLCRSVILQKLLLG